MVQLAVYYSHSRRKNGNPVLATHFLLGFSHDPNSAGQSQSTIKTRTMQVAPRGTTNLFACAGNEQLSIMASNKDIYIVNPDIVSICQSIGRFDKDRGVYVKDDECSISLRDLLREIKKEQEPFLGRRQLAITNVVNTDLIPLIKDHCLEDEELLRIILRLLVILTSSAIYSMGDQVPHEKDRKRLFLELQQDTFKYKVAFSSQFKVWAVLATHLTRILSMEWESRSTNDEMLIEAVFILVTNLLHVSSESFSSMDENPHDRLIHMLDQSGLTELVLLAGSDSSGRFCMYTLEIFSLLLRDQCPKILATFEADGETKDKKKAIDPDLAKIVARDRTSRTVKGPRFKDSTYQIKNLKSLSDRDMIYHKELNADGSISLGNKQILRKARNRQNMKESDFGAAVYDELSVHQSPAKVLRHLSKICHEFLTQYNEFMIEAKQHVTRSQNIGDNSLYLWAVSFFMEFNRNCKKDVSLVSYTYTTESLHFFHTLLLNALDQLRVEKKNFLIWSRRLHYALKAYKELICSLAFADSSSDIEYHERTKEIKWIAFYEEEYRELLPMLLKEYNPVKMSRRYLIDLVCTTHVFLRLFKSYCTVNQTVTVKEKARKPRKSKKAAKEKWRMMIDELRDGLAGKNTLPTAEEDSEVVPVDPTAEFEPDAQKTSVVYRIKKLLEESKPLSAIALYRNARNAWLEDPEQPFGSETSTLEEEEQALKAIYDEVTVEEEDDTSQGRTQERELNFIDFFRKFCVPKAIIPYVMLLKDFDKNSSQTNHAAVKFLYRIAFDCDLYGMLFQASVFRIFQRIFKQPVTDEWSKELNQFSKHLFRKFIEVYPKNNKILVELLFWKTSREARAVEEGYGVDEPVDTVQRHNLHSDDEDERAVSPVDPDKLASDVGSEVDANELHNLLDISDQESDGESDKAGDKENEVENGKDDDDEVRKKKIGSKKSAKYFDDEDEDQEEVFSGDTDKEDEEEKSPEDVVEKDLDEVTSKEAGNVTENDPVNVEEKGEEDVEDANLEPKLDDVDNDEMEELRRHALGALDSDDEDDEENRQLSSQDSDDEGVESKKRSANDSDDEEILTRKKKRRVALVSSDEEDG